MSVLFKTVKTKEFSLFLTLFVVCCSLVPFGDCLYEDQIGKFDWTNHYVGKVNDGFLDDRFAQVYVATEQNVVAALSADTGAIVWRQVLERGDRGTIKFLHFINDDTTNANSVRLNSKRDDDGGLITVTGSNFLLVRGWNVRTGHLVWEWTIAPPKITADAHWFYEKSVLYYVVPTWGSSTADVYEYNARSGQLVQPSAKRITLRTTQADKCDFIKSFLVCTGNNEITSTDLRTGTTKTVAKSTVRHQRVPSTEAVVLIESKLYNLESDTAYAVIATESILHLIKKSNQQILLEANVEAAVIKVKVSNAETGEQISTYQTDYAEHLSVPKIIDGSCKTNKKGEFVCRIVLSTVNGALVQLQAGKVKWIREESLASISAIEMIDLPLADVEGAIEKQLKSKHGDIIGNFIQRATTQLNHVRHLLQTLFDVVSTHTIPTDGELTRDAFGLHTIIVVVTSTGKLFGIDNISGKHHYVTYLPNFAEFNNEQHIQIIVERTSKHFPHPAQVTILAKHARTGNGLLYQFNPITGTAINGGLVQLDYAIRQVSVLQPGADFLRGILLLDSQNRLHVFPETMLSMAHGTYIYSADKETGIVTGYYVEQQDKQLKAIEIWRDNLSGFDNSQKITQIASKNPNEHVHSQGRVMNDRSVLYKYINPNLVAIVTQGTDNIYKYVLNVHLIDVVSGGVVSTITHRRVRGPVNIVHSENWLVYTYYNEKVRRTELTAIELYEGNTQANSTVWTSFDAPPLPAVVQQSYIIPSNVLTLRETITEKGITHKHILIGLSSGGIVEMPWHLLDPRRPVLGNNQPREEGTIPYMPELPLSSESVINYNKSIARLQGIYSAPSGLESTCLVVAYGLDFFVTRVAPSKTYDLLKEDFDYFLISTVLLGLTAASFIVKYMSAKKTLKQAWK